MTAKEEQISSSAAQVKDERAVDKLRRCFKANKIFFETLAACLLSFMAIVVSLLQVIQNRSQNQFANNLAKNSNELARIQADSAAKQTELLDLQTKIAMQQVVPQFVIAAKQIADESGFATEDQIVVRNVGGVVRELYCDDAVFLEVELYHQNPREGNPIKKRLPLNGYYAAIVHNPEGQGQVLTLIGNKNNKRAIDLERAFGKLTESNGLFGFTELRRYLRLRYRDMLGEHHEDFFYVPLTFGAHKLTEEEGKLEFDEHSKGIGSLQILEFEQLTPEIVLQKARADSERRPPNNAVQPTS